MAGAATAAPSRAVANMEALRENMSTFSFRENKKLVDSELWGLAKNGFAGARWEQTVAGGPGGRPLVQGDRTRGAGHLLRLRGERNIRDIRGCARMRLVFFCVR